MSEDLISVLKDKFHTVAAEPQSQCVIIGAKELKAVCSFLKEGLGFDYLMNLAAIDYKDKLAVVYNLYSFNKKEKICLKIFLDRNSPCAESVTGIYLGADWHEREAYDLMGINFTGHPDLRRILLPDDWQGHPLRKDYEKEGLVRLPQV